MKKHGIIRLILLVTSTLLFLLLAASLFIPLSYGSTDQYISNATLQLARSNGFAKNALLLQYGTKTDQAQAISDLQVALPLFESEQNILLLTHDQNAQATLQAARGNYLAIVDAVSILISHGETSVDPTQVSIIGMNSRGYNTTMNSYLLILQNQANDFNTHLVVFQEIIAGLLGVCILSICLVCMSEVKAMKTKTPPDFERLGGGVNC